MDDIRGRFSDHSEPYDGEDDLDLENEDDAGVEPPPAAIGSDERRMQVRAYNFWASMLDDRNFPAIEDLDPTSESDFGPYSVLLDFTAGIDNPAIAFLGKKLADECGLKEPINYLEDVPSRSLLSRITDHYLQIIANQAPIGFEAEFVNQRGSTILYRGILLPYSSDDETIDFIYGVINWKELADQQTTDELMLQIDQALESKPSQEREETPLADWADSPTAERDVLDLGAAEELSDDPLDYPEPQLSAKDALARLRSSMDGENAQRIDFANPRAGLDESAADEDEDEDDGAGDAGMASLLSLMPPSEEPAATVPSAPEAPVYADLAAEEPVTRIDLPAEPADGDMALADWLASARELADQASASEDRSRKALYAAIGRAYDFSLAALAAPDELEQILEDAGLTVQDRAPMTPVVKLVFGADYDKTRLTEYATALTYAHHREIAKGAFADLLVNAPGGLKGIVAEERRRRRAEAGKSVEPRDTVSEALARKLRKLDTRPLSELPAEGAEFTVLLARRMADGTIAVLGEVANDVPLIERTAKKLLG